MNREETFSMGMEVRAMVERPDYVKNFSKPKNTEIKFINGNWYLYQKFSVYDPVRKKKIKKSGPIIGKIGPDGFKESVHRKKKEEPRSQEEGQENSGEA